MKARILVVDDEPLYHTHYCQLCHGTDITVDCVTNGREALDFLATEPKIDLIILDFSMPVMDGLTFLKHRSKSPKLLQIPVMMSTSYSESDPMFFEAKSKGWIREFMPKGCSLEVFLEALEGLENL